ncbi:DUF2878 domain-containing protein [bacterium AH-315-K03]|nr:DUF2878 domain-containing protein [bacterium AH-315-K03]
MKLSALNVVCYQLGWFSCVLGGDRVAVFITALCLILHGKFVVSSKKEWWLIGGLSLTGLLVDSALSSAGVFIFETQNSVLLIPIWLLCIWVLFSTTLCHSLVFLQSRLPLAIVLGAVAGPSSYFAGSSMASVTIAEPLVTSLMMISLSWAIIFPCSLLLARRCH